MKPVAGINRNRKTEIKMKTTKNYEVNCCNMCGNGYKIAKRIWWKRMFNHINTLPTLLIIYQWSREPKWNRARASTMSVHTSPKDRNCDICLRTKITRDSYRRRTGTVVNQSGKFGDLTTADHKILSEGSESRNNHRYAVVAQDLATQWLQSCPCKTKTSQETQKSLMKFLEPTWKPKVMYTYTSSEFGNSCQEFSWNRCTSTPHRSETNGIAERAVRRVKEETSAVLPLFAK